MLIRIKNILSGTSNKFVVGNLVSEQHKLIVGWTPKAACTVGAKMFFNHIGLLDEALAYHFWIHKYRQIYQQTNVLDVKKHWKADFLKVKLVRNPYTRVVSGYTHCMAQKYLNDELCHFFKLSDRTDLTFEKYLDYVEAKINRGINQHNGSQVLKEELEKFKYDKIVKIENLQADLEEIKQTYGVDFKLNDKILSSDHHREKDKHFTQKCFDLPFNSYSQKTKRKVLVPDYNAFYNPEIKNRVSRIFSLDIQTYNYYFDL